MSQVKRGPGRPRTGRRPRIDITISQEALDFIEWLIGRDGNLSGFLDAQIKAHPRFEEWRSLTQQVTKPARLT